MEQKSPMGRGRLDEIPATELQGPYRDHTFMRFNISPCDFRRIHFVNRVDSFREVRALAEYVLEE